MMKDISHLQPEERKHFNYCEHCENYFDRRDLAEVFLHAEGNCAKGKQKRNVYLFGSARAGNSEEFFNDDDKMKICLN